MKRRFLKKSLLLFGIMTFYASSQISDIEPKSKQTVTNATQYKYHLKTILNIKP